MDLAALRSEFKERFDSSELGNPIINAHIVRAYRRTARRAKLDIHLTFTDRSIPADTSEIDLGTTPQDSIDIASAGVTGVYNVTDEHPMDPVDSIRHRLRIVGESEEHTGPPHAYEIIGSRIRVFPTPTAATTIRLYHFLFNFNLPTDTSTPLLPSDFHHILVSLALSFAKRDDRKDAEAQSYRREWEEGMADMLAAMAGGPTELYPELADEFFGA